MSSEIVFIDSYSCPHCRAELETRIRRLAGVAAVPGLRAAVAPAGAGGISRSPSEVGCGRESRRRHSGDLRLAR